MVFESINIHGKLCAIVTIVEVTVFTDTPYQSLQRYRATGPDVDLSPSTCGLVGHSYM